MVPSATFNTNDHTPALPDTSLVYPEIVYSPTETPATETSPAAETDIPATGESTVNVTMPPSEPEVNIREPKPLSSVISTAPVDGFN